MDVKSVLDSKGRRVMTARPRATIATIAHRFRQERIGALVITDDDEKTILGIVSERDVVHGLSNHGAELLAMRVEQIMTREVATCSPGDKLKTVMAQMTRLRARHIPAVENGVLCGLISIGDVVKHRLDDLEMEASVLRDYAAAR